MKKLFLFFAAVAALASCAKENPATDSPTTDSPTTDSSVSEAVEVVINAVAPETKVIDLLAEGVLCSSVNGIGHEDFTMGDSFDL